MLLLQLLSLLGLCFSPRKVHALSFHSHCFLFHSSYFSMCLVITINFFDDCDLRFMQQPSMLARRVPQWPKSAWCHKSELVHSAVKEDRNICWEFEQIFLSPFTVLWFAFDVSMMCFGIIGTVDCWKESFLWNVNNSCPLLWVYHWWVYCRDWFRINPIEVVLMACHAVGRQGLATRAVSLCRISLSLLMHALCLCKFQTCALASIFGVSPRSRRLKILSPLFSLGLGEFSIWKKWKWKPSEEEQFPRPMGNWAWDPCFFIFFIFRYFHCFLPLFLTAACISNCFGSWWSIWQFWISPSTFQAASWCVAAHSSGWQKPLWDSPGKGPRARCRWCRLPSINSYPEKVPRPPVCPVSCATPFRRTCTLSKHVCDFGRIHPAFNFP